METFKEKMPEIKSRELLHLINSLPLEHYGQFSFNGVGYTLLFFDKEELEGDDIAWNSASTAIEGGRDIYILETLSEEEKRKKIFHEILESDLYRQGFEMGQCHDIAARVDEEVFG